MHIELFAKDQTLLYRMATELAMEGYDIDEYMPDSDSLSLSVFTVIMSVTFYMDGTFITGFPIRLTEKNYSETLNLILCKTL